MTQIFVLNQDFAAAKSLVDLLTRRRLTVACASLEEATEKADTFVCAAEVETALGGQKELIAKARQIGATRMVVVTCDADHFERSEELGGRLQRVSLPKCDAAPLRNAPLMMLAELLGTPYGGMIAGAETTGSLMDLAQRVAQFDVSVFINGPTGSGKEVLARHLHNSSPRADKPFVAINCAAIPENMLEAMLFGHEKGSFTGANTANKGIMRAADGGTLLLDEISEMPLGLQAKLLRVLQEKTVTPLGSQTEVSINVRVIATSNRDMEEEVRKGTFREDLYFRLNVFPLETQALCDRPDDIPVLAQAMLSRHSTDGTPVPMLTPEACELLLAHHWPGNVRELENVMQRAMVLRNGTEIASSDIMISARACDIPAARAA